jgi:hypothetical protein
MLAKRLALLSSRWHNRAALGAQDNKRRSRFALHPEHNN